MIYVKDYFSSSILWRVGWQTFFFFLSFASFEIGKDEDSSN